MSREHWISIREYDRMLPLAYTEFILKRALTKEALTAAASQGHSSQELQVGDDRTVSFLSTKYNV